MQPIDSIRRFAALATYQITLALGLLLLPLALIAGRVGLTLPIGRLVVAAERAYADAVEKESAD